MLTSSKTFWELLKNSDINAISLIDELNRLYREGTISVKNGVIYPKKSISQRNTRCKDCSNGFLIDGFGDIYYRFRPYYEGRPENIFSFDQGSMGSEDVFKRLAFIYDKGDLSKTNILILGDDDLLSVAISMTELPSEIVVLDVDRRVIEYIDTVSRDENLGIKTGVYNVEDEISLKKDRDLFISDPVEALSGIKLFLSRGISTLVDYGRFYFGLTHIDSSLSKWQKIENMLLNGGCVITDIVRNFASYPGIYSETIKERLLFDPGPPPKAWYSSSLIRGVKLEDKISALGSVSLGEGLYKDRETITNLFSSR